MSWSLIVPTIKFLLQIVSLGSKQQFGLLWTITWSFLGPHGHICPQPRFWPRQCSYQTWKESVKKCDFYGVYEQLGNLTRTLTLRSGPQKGHQKISQGLKLHCTKYQVCTTNSVLQGAETKFCSRKPGWLNNITKQRRKEKKIHTISLKSKLCPSSSLCS